jgi:putative ABC transport system substrate-binding protein
MKRRTFITLIGGAAAWPLVAHAQSEVPVIGFLSSLSSDYASHLVAAFRKGVTEVGFADGHSVNYEYRYADGDYSLLTSMTAELVRRRVAVIAAGAPPAAVAPNAGTATRTNVIGLC